MEHEAVTRFVLQVAVILLSAKIVGGLCARYLRQPSVLGELAAGMIIGPYALGGIEWFGLGPLFPLPPGGASPVSDEVHGLAVLASAVLLFLAGLETDVRKFLRYSVAGLVTGLGGALLSFTLGSSAVVLFGFADSLFAPPALFLGTVATATSVGITARVLSDKRQMDSAEGATILSGAVIDDIIGLVLLAMVLNLHVQSGARGEGIRWNEIFLVAGGAGAFWVVTMALGILGARHIARFLGLFGGSAAVSTAALGMALLLAALAQSAGLALIIGAYTMGISLSQVDRAHELQARLRPIYDFLVPLFFCVMGMMVDFGRIGDVLLFGLVFAAFCAIGKVAGCGAAAYPLGFNTRGALRIGVGMMPRQEVALIVAGVALTAGGIGKDVFGGVVVMTFATTLLAPILLARLFDGRSGFRRETKEPVHATERFSVELPSAQLAGLVARRMVEAFRREEFFVHHRVELGMYEMRKETNTVFLEEKGSAIVFSTNPANLQYTRLIVLEEIIALREIFRSAANFGDEVQLKQLLLGED